jgi:prolyl-tRNA synthetase
MVNVDENRPVEAIKFSEWYLEVLKQAELTDYSPTRGCMVIRPHGFAIWELMQKELDRLIKQSGCQNAYFPLLIPESFLNKEKNHLEGFSPELAVVTHAGGEKLEEPLVVRPTSETIIYHMFAKWIKSYRDLPLKINQWANVVRWEMRTKPFLRTTEFLWQEGHTAHATEEEALATAKKHLEIYTQFVKDYLALPVFSGPKPESEKFAGAKVTFTMEPIMRDGKALQLGTAHLLEHSFPQAFGVGFQDQDGTVKTPWCTSWGVTTRLVGAAILGHGDETGLVLPPKIAPIQVAVVPIQKANDAPEVLHNFKTRIVEILRATGVRFAVFDGEGTPGARFFQAEQKGIPLRLEFGARDIASNQVILVTRLAGDGIDFERKTSCELLSLSELLITRLEQFQNYLYRRAQAFKQANLFEVATLEELRNGLKIAPGFYKVLWCENGVCEEQLKSLSASFRVVLERGVVGPCFVCHEKATCLAIAAKAY